MTHLRGLLAPGHGGVGEERGEVGAAVEAVLEGDQLALYLLQDASLHQT
jgi:hypothetical protein